MELVLERHLWLLLELIVLLATLAVSAEACQGTLGRFACTARALLLAEQLAVQMQRGIPVDAPAIIRIPGGPELRVDLVACLYTLTIKVYDASGRIILCHRAMLSSPMRASCSFTIPPKPALVVLKAGFRVEVIING